jgi:uncharacterized protein (DUF2062 family)
VAGAGEAANGLRPSGRAPSSRVVQGFIRRRIVDPLKDQLTQGVSPGRLALALALGGALGVLPVLGVTTVLCGAVAAGLRLNQPAIQVANYAAYPLQLLLYLPFFQAGARLFGMPPVGFTLAQIEGELTADLPGTVARYAGANLRAVAAWGLAAPLAGIALFFLLRALLARLPVRSAEPSKP